MHSVQHGMAQIAASGSLPMQKAPIMGEGRDARMLGNLLASETISLMRVQDVGWQDIAWRIINLTTDGRVAYINALDKTLASMREDTQEVHGLSDKQAKTVVGTASVMVSRCRTIAKAFNGGGSIIGLAIFAGVLKAEEAALWEEAAVRDACQGLGAVVFYNYAQTFSKSTAGRKPDTLLVKLGKWVEAQKKGATDMTAEDRKILDDIIKFYNDHAPV